ncbi:transposase [uncultured Thiohalocapsa sp.]|uniref:transposase n=1 Tax=uncultured Thiohalocapsa sp. TaxID=768990 RepID=UPI0034577AED
MARAPKTSDCRRQPCTVEPGGEAGQQSRPQREQAMAAGVASPQLAERSAKQLVRLYRQCMQSEETFRDMKRQHFGERRKRSRSRSVGAGGDS